MIQKQLDVYYQKKFLNKLENPLIKIIDINGKKTAPLEIVWQVPIKIKDIETTMDTLITESGEYNVLVKNQWMKKIKAKADWESDKWTVT